MSLVLGQAIANAVAEGNFQKSNNFINSISVIYVKVFVSKFLAAMATDHGELVVVDIVRYCIAVKNEDGIA